MPIKLVLAATCRENGEVKFLMNGDMMPMVDLTGISYQAANTLFEEIFGYYPYPYCILRQVGFIDDITEEPLLVYYVFLPEKEMPKVGEWVGFDVLAKKGADYVPFSIYNKCLVERTV